MPKVEIYTSMLCGYCHRAKRLLKAKDVPFTEVDVLLHPGRRGEMRERAGGSNTLPQVFIDGEHVGGCEELYALDDAGELDAKLGAG
jgi:glutaredoxin 3